MSEQYCVMNSQKQHRADVRGLQLECNREYANQASYKGNIDPQRTPENRYLVKSDDWNASISDVLEAEGVKENRASVVLVTTIYSASPEWFEQHTKEEAEAYFETCLEYERKTKGTPINAVIHWDEKTPHMHVATVPVVAVQDTRAVPIVMKDEDGNEMTDEDGNPVYERYTKGKSKGQVKYRREKIFDENGAPVMHVGLSAKTVFGNKVAMSKRQTEFYEVCGKPFGMSRGEIRVETPEVARKHLTEAQMRAQGIVKDAEAEAQTVTGKAERNAAETEARARLTARQQLRDAEKVTEEASQMRLEASAKLAEATKALEAARSTLDELQALKTAQDDPTEAKLKRALKFMDSIPFKSGGTALTRFNMKERREGFTQETERERMATRNARLARMKDDLNSQMQALQGSKGDSYGR